jgi:hypothetical protein
MTTHKRAKQFPGLLDDAVLHFYVKNSGVQTLPDIVLFWKQRDPALQRVVMPFLWYPVTGAAIERSFSLAGVYDSNDVWHCFFMHRLG